MTDETKRKPGRPAVYDEPRDKLINFRVSASELATLESAAADAGQSVPAWVRELVLASVGDDQAVRDRDEVKRLRTERDELLDKLRKAELVVAKLAEIFE